MHYMSPPLHSIFILGTMAHALQRTLTNIYIRFIIKIERLTNNVGQQKNDDVLLSL